MATFTDAQLAQLQQLTGTLATDQTAADQATLAAAAADAAATTADQAATQAAADQTKAVAQVATDITALTVFVDGLSTPVTPPAPVAGKRRI